MNHVGFSLNAKVLLFVLAILLIPVISVMPV